MNLKLFKESLSQANPPEAVSAYIKALWYDEKGDWDKAHKIIQDIEDADAAWNMLTYIEKKAIFLMQTTGTARQEEKDLLFLYLLNGSTLLQNFYNFCLQDRL